MQANIDFRFGQLEDFLEQFPLTCHKQASLLWKAAPPGTVHLDVNTSCPGKGLVSVHAVVTCANPRGVRTSNVLHVGPASPDVLKRENLLVFLTEKILYWQNAQ